MTAIDLEIGPAHVRAGFLEEGHADHADVAVVAFLGSVRAADRAEAEGGDLIQAAAETVDLDRGEERFNIYCSPCHGKTGEGNGMVVQRGYRQAANFHIDRLRVMPIGYFVDVMANGFGAMPDYRMQLTPADRWRVAAFVRALQLSHAAAESDVPAAELERLKSGAPAPAAAAGAHGSQK
jgi:mono/diheme cytochrome c family protein